MGPLTINPNELVGNKQYEKLVKSLEEINEFADQDIKIKENIEKCKQELSKLEDIRKGVVAKKSETQQEKDEARIRIMTIVERSEREATLIFTINHDETKLRETESRKDFLTAMIKAIKASIGKSPKFPEHGKTGGTFKAKYDPFSEALEFVFPNEDKYKLELTSLEALKRTWPNSIETIDLGDCYLKPELSKLIDFRNKLDGDDISDYDACTRFGMSRCEACIKLTPAAAEQA